VSTALEEYSRMSISSLSNLQPGFPKLQTVLPSKSTSTIEATPTDERPRERCLEKGPESLSLRECLALIIGSGPKGVGCMGLASKILSKPGEGLSQTEEERAFFNAVEVAAPGLLHGVFGLGDANRAKLLATFELARRYAIHREQVKRPRNELQTVQELSRRALSKVPVALRNDAREWLGFVPHYRSGETGDLCVVERGVRTHVNIDPGELFARVLALRPQSFYLVHNHPSGNTSPSPQDYDLTRRVQILARQLGLRLLGHWIVAPDAERWLEIE
jgi:DNA repair protein RadC